MQSMQSVSVKTKNWPKFWDDPFFVVADGASALKRIAECRLRDREMISCIEAARKDSRQGDLRDLVRRYLASCSAQVVAFAAASRRKRKLALTKFPSADLIGIVTQASVICPWDLAEGRLIARVQWKRDGTSVRLTRSANVYLYAQELLCSAAAKAASVTLDAQFMSTGKGGKIALEKWLRETLPTGAMIITMDVPRCFALMKHSSVVVALPLPGKVKEKVLFEPMARTKYPNPSHQGPIPMETLIIAQASSSNRGISEGSALSSVASELVLAMILREVSDIGEGVHVASHGDNLIVIIDDEGLKEPVVQALKTSTCKHFDVPPDELAGRIRYAKKNAEFEFCRRYYRWKNGKLHIRLPGDYVSDFVRRTMTAMEDVRSQTSSDARIKAIDKIERSIAGWLAQSKPSPKMLREVMALLAMMPDRCPKRTMSGQIGSFSNKPLY